MLAAGEQVRHALHACVPLLLGGGAETGAQAAAPAVRGQGGGLRAQTARRRTISRENMETTGKLLLCTRITKEK